MTLFLKHRSKIYIKRIIKAHAISIRTVAFVKFKRPSYTVMFIVISDTDVGETFNMSVMFCSSLNIVEYYYYMHILGNILYMGFAKPKI